MRTAFVFLYFYQIVCATHQEKKGFLVTAPSTLLVDSEENVCVSLHNASQPVRVTLTLVGSYSSQTLASTSSSVNTAVSCLRVVVPQTTEQLARLVVGLESAEPQLSGYSEQTVQLAAQPLVLVSSDKPLYRPGQLVHFRVLSLTHKLRPRIGQINKVWVETPAGVRVQQWSQLAVSSLGMVQQQFALDNEAFLGQWKIKVQLNSSKIVERSFWVKEYVPAKFEVMVQPPADILPNSNNISWQICAKYSYGEVVQGHAHAELQLRGLSDSDQPSVNLAGKLNAFSGCVVLTVAGSALGLSDPLARPSAVVVTATVTEQGTGVTHAAVLSSPIHSQPFDLQFQCSQYFKPGLPYKGNVVMRTMAGRPYAGVGERVQVCVKVRYRSQLATKLLHCWNYTADFSSQVVFALPDIDDPLNVQLITLIATAVDHPTQLYPGSSEVMLLQPSVTLNVKPWHSPSLSYLDVWTRTTLACATTHAIPVYYSVTAPNATTPLFYYLVESRGDILLLDQYQPQEESVVHSNDVSRDETSTVRSWRLPLPVTHAMSPHSHLTVYYVRPDGEVVSGTTSLAVDRCFENKVRVRWEELQVSPKQSSRLCVRASPHSLCSVSVVDKQLTYNVSRSADTDYVWQELSRFSLSKPQRDQRLYCKNKEESPPGYDLRRRRSLFMLPQDYSDHVDTITAFDDLGVTVISNFVLETRPCVHPVLPKDMFLRSSDFYFNNMVELNQSPTPDNLMMVTRPDTQPADADQSPVRDYFPDTWIWSLVDTGREGEVSVENPAPDTITSWDTRVLCISQREGLGVAPSTTLSVFQPFFIHVEAPYSIKKDESVSVKVIVYNYMHHSLPIVVKFPVSAGLIVSPVQDVRLCLKELSPHSLTVSVTALTAGQANMTVQAQVEPLPGCGPPDSPAARDTVVKQLLVKHSGYLQQRSQSALICPAEDAEPSVTWEYQLPSPDNLVAGSASLQLSVAGDLFGPVLENLDGLVQLPMGCGEQNLARLAPNLFVLRYLDTIGHEDKQLRAKALKNVQKGYQRQLQFQRSDGSFSAFGDKDESGSLWLTTAVIRTLSEAKTVMHVDEDVLQDGVVWVARQQLENGCFPVVGQVFHIDVKEAEESTAVLSAFVLASLSASRVTLPAALRTNAEFCLSAASSSTDPYTLAVSSLALVRLGLRQRALDTLQSLLRLAITEHDVVHWGKPDFSVSHKIVTTSYAVLTLVEVGGPQNMLLARKAVRWISLSRNEHGGFVSTQDTVVALEALTAYTTALPPASRTALVVLVTGGQLSRTLRLSDHNRLVQQQLTTVDVPPSLSVAVVGDGCAVVQSVVKYHVLRPEQGSLLRVTVSSAAVSTVDVCSVRELRLCAGVASPGQVTHMALLTVMMVTGFAPDRSHLSKISHPHIKKWEEEDDQIAFYLTEVSDLPICFSLLLARKFPVEDPLPVPVTLIDYYHPEISSSVSYSFECSPVTPLEEPDMQLDSPADDRFSNFHNVNFDLETPSGVEGPKPVYACPPNSTLPNCKP